MEINKEAPPLTQPLENIEIINTKLADMHLHMNIDHCQNVTAEQVALAMLPTVVRMASQIDDPSFINTIAQDIEEAFVYADAFIAEMNRRKSNG